jgi:hypothetical protein
VEVSMVAALAAADSAAAWLADSVVAGWPAVSVAVNFVAAVNFVVMDFVIATSGAAASDMATATTRMTTMTTTLTVIRMGMGIAITRMDMATALTTRMGMDTGTALTRTPPTTMGTKTTAVAMWFSDACAPRVAAANPASYAVDGLS